MAPLSATAITVLRWALPGFPTTIWTRGCSRLTFLLRSLLVMTLFGLTDSRADTWRTACSADSSSVESAPTPTPADGESVLRLLRRQQSKHFVYGFVLNEPFCLCLYTWNVF